MDDQAWRGKLRDSELYNSCLSLRWVLVSRYQAGRCEDRISRLRWIVLFVKVEYVMIVTELELPPESESSLSVYGGRSVGPSPGSEYLLCSEFKSSLSATM
ncbi:Protein of unknown function [Cotesia congregata]|uniref:Uncharacterized protein n=1 Tax=Cotesia congregata TaxID=51543 RepID=A0A8J2MSU4_COTCN|nr:Protein of unknown function [Cotesia congregata]